MRRSAFYYFLKKPLVAGISAFIGLLVISQFIAYQKYLLNENEEKTIIHNEAHLIEEKLEGLVMYSYAATKSLAYIVERNGIPEDFDKIAIELLEINQYFDVVELVDSKGFITHVFPLEDNEVLGFNIIESATSSSGALATIKRGDFFIAGPINLKQGGVGIISRQPIFIEGKFAGFSAVVTKLSTFFNDLNIDASNDNRFIYQLSRVNIESGDEEFFLENNFVKPNSFTVPIDMDNGEWKLYVMPLYQTLNSGIWYAVIGFLLSMVASWGIWFFAGQSDRVNKLINSKLLRQELQLQTIHESSKAKVKRSESNLNKAQEIAKIGSWEFEIDTNKLTWSKAMYKIFEKDSEKFEVTYQAFLDMVHPDDKGIVIKNYADSVANRKSYQINYRLKLDDGYIKYVNEQGETVYDENQKPKKSFCIIQDITDRKEIEDVLTNSVLLYRSLASNAPIAIFNTDTVGACTYVNEEWMKYSGMNFTESMGFGWHKAIHPEDRDSVLIEWQEAILTNSEFKKELRFQDKKGKITYLEVRATQLRDVNNKSSGYIGIASDITERIDNETELLNYKNNLEKLVNSRTEELNNSKEALLNLLEDINYQSLELEKEKVKAQSADLMKSSFLATMSHELRTPMNSIIGFTGILLKEFAGPLNDEQKKQLSMVKTSGHHLLGLINDVLDISKIEAGKLKVSLSPFDYLKTLEKTLDFLVPQASKKELILKTEISQLKITLNSDERRVEQVLLNLLSNAIKFSNKGAITVKVDIVDNWLITQVKDQGIGISAKDINKLFMPFIQLDSGLSRSHEGTGLGLAICKNLIEKLGGTIEAQSKAGKGSNFTFKLPLE